MLKLGCYELPDDCKVELRRIVDDIPANELLAYAARLQPPWARGVRLIPDNLATLQERMFRGLATRSKLNNAQFQFLAAGLSCRFIHQLDVTFIDEQLGALIEEYGRVALVLTLLTDERIPVQEFAARVAVSNPERDSGVRSKLREQLNEMAAAMYKPSSTADEQSLSAPATDNSPGCARDGKLQVQLKKVAALEKDIVHLRQELKERKAECLYLNRELCSLRSLEAEVEQLREKCTTGDAELTAARSQCLEYAACIQHLRQSMNEEVDQQAEAMLKQEVFRWVAAAGKVESVSAELQTELAESGLEDQIESVLKKQKELDAFHQCRSEIREEIQRMEAYRVRLTEAVEDSLNPLPDLIRVLQVVEKRMHQLDDLLNVPAPCSAVAEQLKRQIRIAADHDALRPVAKVIHGLAELQGLPESELTMLQSEIKRRQDVLYLPHVPGVGRPLNADERLLQRIHRCPVLVLLDGHNIVLTQAEHYAVVMGDPTTERAARNQLVHMCMAITHRHSQIQIHCFFDGPESKKQQPSPCVSVIYSGGTGEHRADTAMCNYIEFLNTEKNDRFVVVVTDDRDLRSHCIELGAQVASTSFFMKLSEE